MVSSYIDGAVLVIGLYADDFLTACNNIARLDELKKALSSNFRMKYINEAFHCLGIEIHRKSTEGKLYLSQEKYARAIAVRLGPGLVRGREDCRNPGKGKLCSARPTKKSKQRTSISYCTAITVYSSMWTYAPC